MFSQLLEFGCSDGKEGLEYRKKLTYPELSDPREFLPKLVLAYETDYKLKFRRLINELTFKVITRKTYQAWEFNSSKICSAEVLITASPSHTIQAQNSKFIYSLPAKLH